MSLRVRLFLLLGCLVAILVAAQWWMVRALSRELPGEVGGVAFSVGESLVTRVVPGVRRAERDVESRAGERVTRRVVLRTLGDPAGRKLEESELRLLGLDDDVQAFAPPAVRPPGQGPPNVAPRAEEGGDSPVDDLSLGPPEGPSDSAGHEGEPREKWNGGPHRMTWVMATTGAHAQADAVQRLLSSSGDLELSVDASVDAAVLRLRHDGEEEAIPIPLGGIDEALSNFHARLLGGSAVLLVLGLAVAGLVAHRATAPLQELGEAARAVGSGELGTQVPTRSGGEVGAAIAAFNHMSSRLRALDEDARALRAREHLGELGEVARGLAHGLRNPLNALGLCVDELVDAPDDAEERLRLTRAARRQVARMDAALRSFLALASSGRAAAEEGVDVVSLAEDVALGVAQDERGRVGVAVRAGGDVPLLRAVPAELRAVLQALIVNAVEASPEGGRVLVRVEGVEPTPSPDAEGGTGPPGGGTRRVRVVVEDEGRGVAAEVRERLYTPHVTTKAHGSGMGLYLAHRIATTRHAGSLVLSDREPRGTRAILELGARHGSREGDGRSQRASRPAVAS